MHARERLVAAELRGQRIAGGVELLQVLGGPPVVQLAGFIEQCARVVETEADLVCRLLLEKKKSYALNKKPSMQIEEKYIPTT
nr:hypothetical protein [Acinetobacter baumannii]